MLLDHHRDRESVTIRSAKADEIKADAERIFVRLRAGEAANVGQVAGLENGKQWTAQLAFTAGELARIARQLSDERFDDVAFPEFKELCKQADEAELYLRHLQNSDGREGLEWKRQQHGTGDTGTGARHPDPPTAPIDRSGIAVLACLKKHSPALMVLADIESATKISRATVGNVVAKLVVDGYACKPRGMRKSQTSNRQP
jgi:hypothetical protein